VRVVICDEYFFADRPVQWLGPCIDSGLCVHGGGSCNWGVMCEPGQTCELGSGCTDSGAGPLCGPIHCDCGPCDPTNPGCHCFPASGGVPPECDCAGQ
jgi:hypothetical protein